MTHPLTHHEMLGLVEPFTRRGRHADLAASDRLERRVVFKPIERAAEAPTWPRLREVLQLENPAPGHFRLTRFISLPSGLEAGLEVEGAHPGELLARLEAVAPDRQFHSGAGFVIAHSHRLEPLPDPGAEGAEVERMILTRGVAQVADLTLTLRVPAAHREHADIELLDAADDTLELPEDLLAVLGWSWARLMRASKGWSGTLRLRGKGAERSRDAERKLERTAMHLARTLAEPPGRFHERLLAARWRVAFRRAVPLLVCIGLIAGTASLPKFDLEPDNPMRMMIFNGPPLLLVVFFCLRELPRIEIPPWPRRSTAPGWRVAKPAAGR